MGIDRVKAREIFPQLGYVPGNSQRVTSRLPLITQFWPNVYERWKGHFAGAGIINELSVLLNDSNIICPIHGLQNEVQCWTPWKVNMVFFTDDIVACPGRAESMAVSGGSQMPPPHNAEAKIDPGEDGLCNHRIVNRNFGIHFEPDVIHGELNDSEVLGLPHGEHGLEGRRFLLEFYRMPNGNCKIGGRVRVGDPCFEIINGAAIDSGCPPKQGGINVLDQTSSVFVFPLGKVAKGREVAEIKNFTCHPRVEYAHFLELLPQAIQLQ